MQEYVDKAYSLRLACSQMGQEVPSTDFNGGDQLHQDPAQYVESSSISIADMGALASLMSSSNHSNTSKACWRSQCQGTR